MSPALAPEHRLLVDCARRALGLESSPALPVSIDWRRLVDLALRSAVAPLVHAGRECLGRAPPEWVRHTLGDSYLAAWLHGKCWVEPALREILAAFHGAALEPIVLKGAALAYSVYPAPALRTFADIDLLLPAEQIVQASDLLCRLGLRPRALALPRGHQHGQPHLCADGQIVVELHHHLLPASSPYTLEVFGLRRRARSVPIAGVAAQVLAPPDALLLTCLHLAYTHRYRWFALRSLVDILALTSRSTTPDLDWDGFLGRVHASGAAGAVYWPLRLAHDWLGAPVPAAVLAALAPPTPLRRLVAAVLEPGCVLDQQAPAERGAGALHHLLLELSLYSGCAASDQARAAWATLFPPPEAVTHLPPQVAGSPLRYALHQANPWRGARGLAALCRVVARAVRQGAR